MKKFILPIVLLISILSAKAQVTTLYGNGANGFSTSGTPGASAEFNNPYGIAYDTKGNMWITDQSNNFIILIQASDQKYYPREGQQAGGFQDGAAASLNGGLVNFPAGIIVVPGKTSKNDQIYLCDQGNHAIRKIDSLVDISHAQKLSTVAGGGPQIKGQGGVSGSSDGTGANARFNNPAGLAFIDDGNGGFLIIADKGNNAIRKVSLHKADYGTTSTLATGRHSPEGISVDAKNGAVYLAESQAGGGISKVSITGSVTTVVPGTYLAGPTAVVTSGNDMWIGDGCRIMYFDMTKPVSATNPSVYAGNVADTICDYNDGSNGAALFFGITTMILSTDNKSIIVCDAMNNRIRKLTIGHTSSIETIYEKPNTFNVYPNPSFGHVMVKSQASGYASISVYNTTGQQLFTNNVFLNPGAPTDVNMENLNPGIYILKVASETGVYSEKIVRK